MGGPSGNSIGCEVGSRLRIFTKFSGIWVAITKNSPKQAFLKICPSLEILVSKVWGLCAIGGTVGPGDSESGR